MDGIHAMSGGMRPPGNSPAQAEAEARLRATAVNLEAQFLSEMLKHAGFDGPKSDFSGGSGEEQFGSFLREAQARRMAQGGGIGLAETIFRALQARAR